MNVCAKKSKQRMQTLHPLDSSGIAHRQTNLNRILSQNNYA